MICIGCKEDKHETEFNFRNKAKGLRQRFCRPCDSAMRKASYRNHSKKTISKVNERNRKYAQEYRDWKSTQSCRVCQESASECLDLHHLDPSQKDFEISSWRIGSRTKLWAEIAKCVVLCANCHRKVHSGRITLR